jgi:hypothetical protein
MLCREKEKEEEEEASARNANILQIPEVRRAGGHLQRC